MHAIFMFRKTRKVIQEYAELIFFIAVFGREKNALPSPVTLVSPC